MPLNPVLATEALARGLKQKFVNTYKLYVTGSEAKVGMVMDLSEPSDKSAELYAYFESAPHARRWPRGEDRGTESFRARSFEVPNYDWTAGVSWHSNDEDDDQTRSLTSQASDAGMTFALLPERVLFQYLNAATDLDLLPALPNAPDGAALFSATDGAGNARFGVTGGNTMAGAGLSAADIRSDFLTIKGRASRCTDTKGQPLLPAELLDEWVIIYGSHLEEAFAGAFLQTITPDRARDGGFTNVIMVANIKITLWSTPRITTNNWFARPTKVPHRSLFRQVRQEVRDNLADFTNSDHTRLTKEKQLLWDARFGFGLGLPYDWWRVTNS